MAVTQPAYVEAWDHRDFPELPYRQARDGLRLWREAVVSVLRTCECGGDPTCPRCLGEGSWIECLRGENSVANAITEAWCKDNPTLFQTLIDSWTETARAEGEADVDRQRDEQKSIADHPTLAQALQRNAGAVYQRAGLSPHQIRVLELRFDRQKSLAEIGVAFGVTKDRARHLVDKAIDLILALDSE